MENDVFVLKNCRIIDGDAITEPTDILVKDGIIEKIGDMQLINGVQKYDVRGNYISAGFIDIHTHGAMNSDFMDATDETFDKILAYHLEKGVTGVVATSLTAKREDIEKFLNAARNYMQRPQKYAELIGVHLEGPFLSLKGSGAQNPKYLMDPQKDDYGFIIKNKDIIKTVTIAPELDVDGEMTKTLTQNGILVSGGHDDGAYPEFVPAIRSGLRHLTHIYCAMSGFGTKEGVREIGLREYGLMTENITCEIIADNVHITPEMAMFIIKCKGADKVAVVSDLLRCAGMPADGRLYSMGPADDPAALKVKILNGIAYIEEKNKFAGSITDVHQMVKNLINAGISVTDAFKTATSSPANIIGEKRLGRVQKGFFANLCELDENFDVVSVYMHGKKV